MSGDTGMAFEYSQQLKWCSADFEYWNLSGIVTDENTQRRCIKSTVEVKD